VNAAANVEYLFKLTRLDRVFPICRDVMKAIEVVEREGRGSSLVLGSPAGPWAGPVGTLICTDCTARPPREPWMGRRQVIN